MLIKDYDRKFIGNGVSAICNSQIKKQIPIRLKNRPTLKTILACLLLALQLSLSTQALAATYYIDPAAGSDTTGNGSALSPWKSINKAKSSVSPGDIVNLLPGNYGTVTFGESGDKYGSSWENPIIYQNNPDSPDFSAEFSRIVFKGNNNFYTIISGMEVTNSSSENCIAIGGFETGLKDCAYVKIQNCKIYGSAGASGPTDELVYVQSSNNIFIDNCEVFNSGSLCWGVNVQDSSYVTVSRCHIHDIARSALRTGGGQDYVFEYNNIHTQRPEWGLDPHGSGISIHSHGTTIRGNIVHDGWNTRTIRFYQSVAGANGYHDMLVENNVFYDGQNWSEFIDLGENCVFRNNTFGEYVNMVFAQNADGSGLSIYNNIFAANFQLSNYDASKNDSQQQARANWDAVNEGNNIYTKLVAPGNGYLWTFSEFSASSNSLIFSSLPTGTFFESKSGSNAFQLCQGSAAIDFSNSSQAPATDLLGNARIGQPDAGCYEFGSVLPPENIAPTANAGIDQTLTDTHADGYEQVLLDASASTDSDGSIVSYVWTENGNQIAAGKNPTISLSTGQHTITLTVTDDGGLSDSDTAVITINVETIDETPPSLISVTTFEGYIEILFSEALHPFSANNSAHYSIDGVSISQVTLSESLDSVTLTTSPHTPETTYTLTCTNIADAYGNIMPQTTVNYTYKSTLVGWWQFNEDGGSTANDSSPQNNTGTLINNPTWTDWAIDFDGIDDHVTCTENDSLNITESLTIAACIKPESFGQGG